MKPRAWRTAPLNPKCFCTQCQQWKLREEGKDIEYNEGRNRRWVCGDCKPKDSEE